MTEAQMIRVYIKEIRAAGGIVPEIEDRAPAMQIAKLQSAWRRL